MQHIDAHTADRDFQFAFITDRAQVGVVDALFQLVQAQVALLKIGSGQHDPVDFAHQAGGLGDALVGGIGHVSGDHPGFALDQVHAPPGLVGGRHDLVAVHPISFVVQHVFPARRQQRLAVFFERTAEQVVAVFFGLLEGLAAGVDERRQRRNKGDDAVFAGGVVALQHHLRIIHRLHHALIGLFFQAHHEEQIQALAAGFQGVIDGGFDVGIGVRPAKGAADALVVRFHRNFYGEIGQRLADALEEFTRGSVEELDEDRFLIAGDGIQKTLGIIRAGLADIAQYKHRAVAEFADAADILGQLFRGTESRPRPVVNVAESAGRSAAGHAVIAAAAYGQGGGDGILQPVAERLVTGQVAVAHYRAQHV